MRRWAAASDARVAWLARLEEGGRVGHRLVEEQFEQPIGEVVVVADVAPRTRPACCRRDRRRRQHPATQPTAARAARARRSAWRRLPSAPRGRGCPTRRPCTTRRIRSSRRGRCGGQVVRDPRTRSSAVADVSGERVDRRSVPEDAARRDGSAAGRTASATTRAGRRRRPASALASMPRRTGAHRSAVIARSRCRTSARVAGPCGRA